MAVRHAGQAGCERVADNQPQERIDNDNDRAPGRLDNDTERNGITARGKFIGEGDGCFTNYAADEYFRGGLRGLSRALRAGNHNTAVCVRYETKMIQRDFHKQVRVVYRALRRIYGKVKTQDEALRIFKIVFPELNKARLSESNDLHIPTETIDGIKRLRDQWQPTGEFAKLFDKVINQMEMPVSWDKDVLIQFYEDIMPVVMRIRKLTPRECFRLMNVDEPDIDKIQASGVSNSAQYKLAGNSIVVACLYHIFDKMFIHPEQEYKFGTQLSLF